MIFYVSGKQIFDVGFRPGLVQLADEVGIKAHATNLRNENKVRVIASGSQESVNLYHSESVLTTHNYKASGMAEYHGPDIDWNAYNQQFIAAQLSKTMSYSNAAFQTFNQKLDNIQNGVDTLNKNNNRKKSANKPS
jgi:acylphosphatase